MDDTRRRLELAMLDQQVRDQQERIIELLDAMLAVDEDEENDGQEEEESSSSSSSAQSSGQGESESSNGAGPGESQKGATASSLRDVTSGTEAGGEIDPSAAADDWRRMPEREREQVLETVRERYPERYRALVEQYYQGLQQSEDSR
jgi:hypothetical protein